eukprot:m.54685 g.54685  ORF g.54685 m.54685 type:complete len:923 (+) comp7726_c0_seq3:32-2800(+)
MTNWEFRSRKYTEEKNALVEVENVTPSDDPLVSMIPQGQRVNLNASSSLQVATSDPFEDDPLASMDDPLASVSTSNIASHGSFDDSFEPWAAKKPGILMRYTTSEMLSLASTKLGGRVSGEDKVKQRLEEIDNDEDNDKKMDSLTQKEYIAEIDKMKKNLIKAWNDEKRVEAIKIVIQSSKRLGEVKVMKFYPSKFVLITEILDEYGELVFSRLLSKANDQLQSGGSMSRLPKDFAAEMIPTETKEICRNWFFKIASIRELLPRILVETAMLKSYRFLPKIDLDDILSRLMKQARGIGDPLVAAYTRCYICKVGKLVVPNARNYLQIALDDQMRNMEQMTSPDVERAYKNQRLNQSEYMLLYVPALDWILQCVSHKASNDTLTKILDSCQGANGGSVFLNAVMASFPPKYIAARATQFVELIKDASESGLDKYRLYQTLGFNLNMCSPPEEDKRIILNKVWGTVTKFADPMKYISCVDAWIEYPIKYLSYKQVNVLLRDITSHMSTKRAFESHYDQLQAVANKILANISDFSELFGMDSFLPFVYLFQDPQAKYDVCKSIFASFNERQATTISDQIVLNEMLNIGKILHDKLSLSHDDERKQISYLLIQFLSKASFGRNYEQELEFFVRARGHFSNLDQVLVYQVHRINNLIMKTCAVVKGKHTSKTSPFVRSCISFCFITIPSVSDFLLRLKLYLTSGCVSIVNMALSQGDVFFNAAIDLIPDLPDRIEVALTMEPVEPYLQSVLQDLFSMLLIVPDHPEYERLLITKKLLKILEERQWNSAEVEFNVFLSFYQLFAAFAQRRYIYGVKDLEANDLLYESNPKFIAEMGDVALRIIDRIHTNILDRVSDDQKKASMFVKLFETLASTGDLNNSDVLDLTSDFAKQARKTHHSASADLSIVLGALSVREDLPNINALLDKSQ